jgi:hypothetical protein
MLKRLLLVKVLRMPRFIVSDVVAVIGLGLSAKHLTDSNDVCTLRETDERYGLGMYKCNIAGGYEIRCC